MESKVHIPSISIRRAGAWALLLASLAANAPAHADDVRLLSAAAMQTVFKLIAGDFERTSGHRLTIDYATVGGITQRILDGESPDLIIGSSVSTAKLAQAGKVDEASRMDICTVGVGIVVPAGDPGPQVTTVEDFKKLLLGAKTIVYADPARGGAAGVHVAPVIDQLGLATQTVKLGAGGDVTEVALAQGSGTVGITQISEIVGKPGAQFVGPLPKELQNYTVLTAALPTGKPMSAAVRAFLAFLQSPRVVAVIEARGM